ncbi:lipid storage droplets surface-binding protein 1 isoform X3 [Frankliniella occidentalis]|nr:lipid storage droplets surface-binding protein 1 isoform X3 [Frankliniella occidentalis]
MWRDTVGTRQLSSREWSPVQLHLFMRSRVTISAEFVANEQMNNCVSNDAESPRADTPSTPAASLPVSTPTAAATDSSVASSDEDDHDATPELVPALVEQVKPNKKVNDNHQHSKNQRSKHKRPQDAHKPAAKSPSKHEAPPAASPSSSPAPAAAPAAPAPARPAAAAAAPPPSPSAPAPLQPLQNSHPAAAPPPAAPVTPAPTPNCSRRTASSAFPHMEAVSRVLALPIVDTGVSMVSGVYSKVKNVNPVVQWGLGTAEGAVLSSLGRSLSLLGPLSGPLSVVDAILCRGLDMVEYNVPIITLPPELMMTASRDYMSMRVVAPVLRMTATNARLADTLAARALDSADHYVDKYLPGDAATENGDAVGAGIIKGGAAFKRADRLSRKLQRRITRLTLAEARALRKDTENTLHTLVYFAETLVKDPRAFVEQCRAVWNHLSENEPENQVPPETLEERLALLVREVARRVVHLANYTAGSASTKTVSNVAHHVLKSVRVEGAKVMNFAQSQLDRVHMQQVLGEVNIYTHQLL